jgi:hypothetical protein
VFEDANGGLLILAHPNWRSLVQREDVNYVNDLLIDSLERAEDQPRALFEQLSSLGVGPLVTQQAGERISDYPYLYRAIFSVYETLGCSPCKISLCNCSKHDVMPPLAERRHSACAPVDSYALNFYLLRKRSGIPATLKTSIDNIRGDYVNVTASFPWPFVNF